MVKYVYDAWGNHDVLDAEGKIVDRTASVVANINPFRYRGYYFDVETGLYYLQTRYYDPEVGRFISSDDVSYLDPETLGGLNLYAYCNSNPIMAIDPTGHAWWHWLIAVAVVITLAALTVISAGSFAAGAAAISAAVIGTTAVGASVTTTVCAFATVGAGVVLAASAIVAGINSIGTWATGGSFVDGVNSFMNEGESAMWSTIAGGVIGAGNGYSSCVEYGTKTPGSLKPFGKFYNTKDQTLTHYNSAGEMWWSKHFTDHGRPDLHNNPHWHAEKPHYPGGGFDNFVQLFVELIKRIFGGGHK